MIVASLHNHLQCIDLLIARGARVNSTGCSSRTALHCAAFEGHTDAVERLLAHGADVSNEIADSIEELPLHKAAINGRTGALTILLRTVLDRPQPRATALLNHRNVLESTPLHNAAQHGHVECIQLLLHAGANAAIPDVFDWTPLDSAHNGRHTSAALLLMKSVS